MQPAPTGTVTIACSDIESSTPLWDAAPEAMRQALELHDDILRSLLAHHNGYEFSAEGDALKVAFGSSQDAVQWCMEVQLALKAADWPAALLEQDAAATTADQRGLRVRMGIHIGDPVCRANPVTHRMDYFGPVVNLAARVGSAPHGGQVVATRAVMDQVADTLGLVEISKLGSHHLKGVAHPVTLHQILPAALAARRFPPLRTLATRRTNLVPRPSSFVGRTQELESLKDRLRGQETRLLTLLGPGGTGKTRLSQQAGLELPDHFIGGVWFCDLTEARDVNGICHALASALSIPVTTRDPIAQLGNAILGRGSTLLIMDNFEQVVEHAHTTIGAWLKRAPQARFLISSRERLGLEAEVIQDLEPLPAPLASQTREELIENPGVLLFIERARRVRQEFRIDENSAQHIAGIVRMLDGLPLAIELAAARARSLSPEAILRRLQGKDGFIELKVLRGRSRDRQARQATIRGAIQWSWDLIKPWEKAAMAQCSVFAGGFDLDAAESVLQLSSWPEAPEVDEVVESLVDQSLLRMTEPAELAGETRFEMLKTIQSFARDRLSSESSEPGVGGSSHFDAALLRHGQWYGQLGMPERMTRLNGAASKSVMARMMLELDNLAAVVRLSAEVIPAEVAVGAGLAAMELFDRQGPQHQAITLGEELLSRADLSSDQRARVQYRHGRTLIGVGRVQEAAKFLKGVQEAAAELEDGRLQVQVLTSLAVVYRRLGDGDASEQAAQQALAEASARGFSELEGRVLSELGALYLRRGRFEEARNHLRRGAKLLRATDSTRLLGMTLQNLGHLASQLGPPGEARQAYQAALDIQQQVGAYRNEAAVRGSLALLEAGEGSYESAREHYATALQIQREAGNRRSEGILHGNLADLLLAHGNLQEARQHLGHCLQRAQETGARGVEGAFLGSLGELELRCGRFAQARVALDAGEATLRALDVPLELAKILGRRAELELQVDQPDQASLLLEEVVQISDQLQLEPDSEIRMKVQQIRVKIKEKRSLATPVR